MHFSTERPSAKETNARIMEKRDWTLLPDLAVARLADILLSEDVTEYIRLRAVCPSWRQSTAPPSNLERRFRPANWILITSGQRDNLSRHKVKDRFCFLNVSSGDYLQVRIPQFSQGYGPVSFVDGLLVMLKKRTGELFLLHPFSLSRTELPNVASLLSIVPVKRSLIRVELSSVNFLSSSIVFCFHIHRKVVFAMIGGSRWIGMDDEVRCISTVNFEGKLYAAAWMTGEVLQFELEEETNGSGLDPKLKVTSLIPEFKYPLYHGLLESEGKLLLLQEYYSEAPPANHFEVYEVDVRNRRLILTTIPCDRTFFASESRCLSLSTSISPSIIPESIYYYKRGCPYILVYHSLRPNLASANLYYPHSENIYSYWGPFFKQVGPYSLPCHLICYCSNFDMPPDSLLVQNPRF